MTAARGRYRDRSWAELNEAEKEKTQETRVWVLVPGVTNKLCDPSWVSHHISLGLGFSHL